MINVKKVIAFGVVFIFSA